MTAELWWCECHSVNIYDVERAGPVAIIHLTCGLPVDPGIFQIDGTEHERGEYCACRPERCHRCTEGWIHSQGVWGGLVRECDRCGAPDSKKPPPSCTPDELFRLRQPLRTG